jgi:hypothetical protein
MRDLVWRKRFHLQLGQRNEGRAKVGVLASAAVHQAGHRGHTRATAPDDFEGLLNPSAAGHHVLHHNELVPVRDFEPTPQDEPPGIIFFGENVGHLERPRDFMADDQSTQCGGNDAGGWDVPEFVCEQPADLGCDIRVLQKQCALEKLAAVEAGSENKVAVEKGFGLAEKSEDILVHVRDAVKSSET